MLRYWECKECGESEGLPVRPEDGRIECQYCGAAYEVIVDADDGALDVFVTPVEEDDEWE